MDPSLLRERELFKRKALSTPVVETKKKREESGGGVSGGNSGGTGSNKQKNGTLNALKKKVKASSMLQAGSPSLSKLDSTSYKTMSGSTSHSKFGILTRIVKHMKWRHLEGDDMPLTLEEILDETNQLDVNLKTRQWLSTEALSTNQRIEVTPDEKYIYKPPLKVKDKKSMLRLLKQHDLKGHGGILLDEVQESLPNCEKILKHLGNEIIYVYCPANKKKILFYNDKTASIQIDEEFQRLWRAVPVDSMDDKKIEEYLEKQGIRSMQDHGVKKYSAAKRKKPNRKRVLKKPRDNEHMADVLQNYDE